MPSLPRRFLLLVLLLAIVTAGALYISKARKGAAPSRASVTNALEMLIAYEEQEAQKHWAPELGTRKYTEYADRLWSQPLKRPRQLPTDWPLPGHLPGAEPKPLELPHGILVQKAWGGSLWEIVNRAAGQGWLLEASEIRHIGFRPGKSYVAPVSTFYVAGHLSNSNLATRMIIEGNVEVEWRGSPESPSISLIDANDLQVRTRQGPPPFTLVLSKEIAPVQGSYFIDPLIIWDLDGDGSSEVVLAARNLVLRRHPTGLWTEAPLLPETPPLLFTGILGDFNGDQHTDFLAATFDGLLLYPGVGETSPNQSSRIEPLDRNGSGPLAPAAGERDRVRGLSVATGEVHGEGTGAVDRKGKFSPMPTLAWAAQPRLRYAQALTAGDIDGDGDLDLFLAQYKTPFDKGQMPHPYHDANDGHPSFLLLNDGQGNFTDVTAEHGLSPKRHRRIYSASFVDLDRDRDLDLVVVSDFAGLDAYRNNGQGQFSDATTEWFSDRLALGMGHSFADFNSDGSLDFLMIGMNSPTADRLESLGLHRDPGPRRALTYGNRLLFGSPNGRFAQTPTSDLVARTGWSWGSAAADFDNDGFPDLYIANGHETKSSVRDYEPEFWLHDIYVGNSQENLLAHEYFQRKFRLTRGNNHSYGGHERNRFFLNQGGTNFVEVGHLFGVSLTADSRNVAATDLNGDGKLDLIVTTFEVHPKVRQTIQIFENRLPDTGNWLSVKIPGQNAIGQVATVTAHRTQAFAFPAGEGYRTQIQPTLHLGLGPSTPPTISVSLRHQTNSIPAPFNRSVDLRERGAAP